MKRINNSLMDYDNNNKRRNPFPFWHNLRKCNELGHCLIEALIYRVFRDSNLIFTTPTPIPILILVLYLLGWHFKFPIQSILGFWEHLWYTISILCIFQLMGLKLKRQVWDCVLFLWELGIMVFQVVIRFWLSLFPNDRLRINKHFF